MAVSEEAAKQIACHSTAAAAALEQMKAAGQVTESAVEAIAFNVGFTPAEALKQLRDQYKDLGRIASSAN
jgi:hypothetical protein